MTLTDVVLDIARISVLLFLAFLLRRKVKFFQKYYIPTALIAGILGLLLGPQVLGSFSPVYLKFTDSISQWTNFLFCFIFGTAFLGTKDNKFGRDVICTTSITGSIFMMQVLVGLGLAKLFSLFMDNVPYKMGLLPVAGFYGGHGSAGIMGGVFATEGWQEATGIGMTYATVGMFAAVIGGMVMINYGARKGVTARTMDSNYLTEEDKTGVIEKADRTAMATGVSNSSVLDPMAFQIMIVGTLIAVAHVLREGIIKIWPFWERIPLYTMCLILGAIVGILLSKTKYNDYIDRKSMQRISGTALEFVIASAVATIKLSVLATYLVPIIVTSLVIVVLTGVFAILLSKFWFGKNWFELAMGAFGQCTGSLATGLLLVRVLDPEGESYAAESISGSSTVGSFFQQPYNTIVPLLIVSTPAVMTLSTAGFLAAFLIFGTLLFGLRNRKKKE